MSNKCVCCNIDIPEGIMVCQTCVYKEYGIVGGITVEVNSGTIVIGGSNDSESLTMDSETSLKQKIFKKLNESVPIIDIARQLDINVMSLTDIIFNAIWEEE